MREYTARAQGKIRLVEALDVTRFDVWEGYLDEELDHLRSQQVLAVAARRPSPAGPCVTDSQLIS
jgi:hypothetical protein